MSFLYIIGRFKVKLQNGNIFWVANFQIFLGIPDIPDLLFVIFLFYFIIYFFFFGGGVEVNSRCWVRIYV